MNTLSSLLSFIGSFEPVGSIKMYAGAATPSRWLKCDGSAVSRTTYAKLFAAIGTAYGEGDGSTTFNLPDFQGRTAIGVGTGTASGATAHALAQKDGSETVTLTIDQMPSHTHTQNPHNHTQNEHNHAIPVNQGYHPGNGGSVAGDNAWAVDGVTGTGRIGSISTTATNIQTTATNNNTGGGAAHSNMQPFLAVHYIIFAGK